MPFKKRRLPAVLCAILLPATLNACALPTLSSARIDVTAVACQGFAPLSWSRKDTDQTIIGIKAHNAAYLATCAKKAP